MLAEILEESIRIFWRFIRADKDCYSVMAKGQKGIHPTEVQEQEESELLLEIRKNLEKKEKKLQDVLKSGNCIL
ncbi:hypothetical protein T459_12187 [Capsicum annuum]|uniref:Uncharacterized protein n=1 Tax=Capsicum annuum TaxID=4072 RepID=A0A2G2ZP82_CAPAN|nr:hypothetical protein T459_12187 [Capsicum annuum]